MRGFFKLLLILLVSTMTIKPISAANDVIRIGFYVENIAEVNSQAYTVYAMTYLKKLFENIDVGMEFNYCIGDECADKLSNKQLDFVMNAPLELGDKLGVDIIDNRLGYRHTTLYANENFSYYSFNDFLEIPNMKIGIVSGSKEQRDYEELLSISKYDIDAMEYNSLQAMIEAMEKDEIQGFIYKDLPKGYPYYAITKIKTYGAFFATTHNNPYIDTLIKGMDALNAVSITFEEDLFNKHFMLQNILTSNLNEEELAYIEKNKTVTIAVNPNYGTVESIIDKKLYGITAYIIDMIESRTGLDIQLYETSSYKESVKLFNEGKVDLISGTLNQFNNQITHGLYTKSYLSIPVYNYYNIENAAKKLNNMALLKAFDYSSEFVRQNYQSINIIELETPIEALNMVESGMADIVSLNQFIGDQLVKNNNYKNIGSTTFTTYYDEMAFAVSKNNPVLFTIIYKSLSQISDADIQEAIYQNTLSNNIGQTLISYIEQNPIIVTVIVGLIFSLIVIILLILINQKSRFNKYVSEVAYSDEITGYGNLAYFRKEARRRLNHATNSMHFVLVTVRISKLNNVNILLGASEGEKLLIAVARIINKTLSSDETFGRSTKDEFLVLKRFEDYSNVSDWLLVVQHLLDTYLVNNNIKTRVYLNAGIFEVIDHKSSVDDCIEKANYALKSIEDNTELKYVFYDFRLNDEILLENKIESMMENAIKSEEFEVYLQPKFSLLDNKIIGAEALIRWNSVSEGMLYPDQFIPLFEKNGFIKRLDYFVYEKVLAYLADYPNQHKKMIPISFNLSRIHLHNPQLVEELVMMANNYNVDPSFIEIELTETAFIERSGDIIEIMQQLKDIGFRISMDDFGTGYSSLNLLKDMPLDIVKIDKSFLAKESIKGNDRIVLQSIVSMAKALGLDVICEGVETNDQAEFLRQIGCFQAQGYLYSRPISIAEFDKLARNNE